MKTILKKTAAVIAIVGLFIVSQLPSIVMALWQRNQHQLELWQSIVILILQLMVLIGFYILARKRKLITEKTDLNIDNAIMVNSIMTQDDAKDAEGPAVQRKATPITMSEAAPAAPVRKSEPVPYKPTI